MKIIVISLIFLMSYASILSKELPFQAERMITDFRGVVSNGSNTLCYGDYGIISYSLTGCQTWNQLNIGDKYNIRKIKTVGKEFYGVSEYSIFKSVNNGLDWKNKEIFDLPDVIDFSFSNNLLYILTKTGVLTSDFNLNVSKSNLVDLDDWSVYSEIESDEQNIYIISEDKNIIRYNFSSKTLDTVDLIKQFYPSFNKVTKLKIIDGAVYVSIDGIVTDDYIYSILVRSTDYGNTWSRISPLITGTDCYNFFDNELRFIKLKGMRNNMLGIEYYKIDSTHYAIDSTYFTVINVNDSINRYLFNKFKYHFTEITAVNKDTLIAVGLNKLIAVSFDNGKTWDLKSFFYCFSYSYSDKPLFFVNKELIYAKQGMSKTTYKSRDGGVTWLPSKGIDVPYYLNGGGLQSYIYNENGGGVWFYTFVNDSFKMASCGNVLITKDFGETYQPSFDTVHTFPNSQKSILKVDNKFLYFVGKSDSVSSYTQFYSMDNEFNFADSSRIDSIYVLNMLMGPNSDIYCFSRLLTDSIKTDTTEFFNGKYYIIKSTDKGINWNVLPVQVPFYFVSNWYKKSQKYYASSSMDIYQYDKYFMIPFYYYDNFTATGKIFRFNLESNKFDSLSFEPYFPNSDQKFITYSNKLYALTNRSNFYFNDSFESGFSDINKWDSLLVNDCLYNWNNNESNQFISYWFKDDYGFIVSGKKVPPEMAFYPDYALNLIKITPFKPSAIEEKYNTESDVINSFISPNPSSDYIEINVGTQDTVPDIRIFNVFGETVVNSSELLNHSQFTIVNSQLRIDVSGLPAGVYFVRVGDKVGKFVKI